MWLFVDNSAPGAEPEEADGNLVGGAAVLAEVLAAHRRATGDDALLAKHAPEHSTQSSDEFGLVVGRRGELRLLYAEDRQPVFRQPGRNRPKNKHRPWVPKNWLHW